MIMCKRIYTCLARIYTTICIVTSAQSIFRQRHEACYARAAIDNRDSSLTQGVGVKWERRVCERTSWVYLA